MKLSEIMQRSRFIRGNSKVVFSIDLSGLVASEDVMAVDQYILTIIEKMPKKSMLLLLNVKDLNLNPEIMEKLKGMTVRYNPYFRSSAVVADGSNEEKVRKMTKDLGYAKMRIYSDLETAKKSLLG